MATMMLTALPPYRRKKPAARQVAVVVPLSLRPNLLPEEEVSMRHLCHFLGRYDKFLVAPTCSTVARPGFRIVYCPEKFFGSAAAHDRLLMWPKFYRAFEEYEYILIYHLDSLVLTDELLRWCRSDLDYIGAPWLPCADTPWVKEPRVGNGGFTLMRVERVLQVLYNRYRQRPATYFLDVLTRNPRLFRPLFRALESVNRVVPRGSIIGRLLDHQRRSEAPAIHGRNNDFFWSFHAIDYLPTFKVATVDEGLRFAFEAAPRTCFELNQRRLPFGCHAWAKFDRSFWEPHLLPSRASSAVSTTAGTHDSIHARRNPIHGPR